MALPEFKWRSLVLLSAETREQWPTSVKISEFFDHSLTVKVGIVIGPKIGLFSVFLALFQGDQVQKCMILCMYEQH